MRIFKMLVLILPVTTNAQSNIEILRTYDEASYSLLAVSPNQEYLAGKFRRGGEIEIRNLNTFSLVATLIDENELNDAFLEFSSDNQFLGLGQQNDVRVWNTTTWDQVAIFRTTQRWGAPFSFSPDSAFIFVGNGRIIEKRALPEGHLVASWDASSNLTSITVSPDGLNLASGTGFNGSDVAVIVWNIENGEQLLNIEPSLTYGVASIAYESDGRVFATARRYQEGPIEVWNSSDGTKFSVMDPASIGINLTFSNNGEILFANGKGEITLWDWKIGRKLTVIPGISKAVPGSEVDEFFYLTKEGYVRQAKLPVWLRKPMITNHQITFEWLGREGTFQLQQTSLIGEEWENVGMPTSDRMSTISTMAESGFYRLVRD